MVICFGNPNGLEMILRGLASSTVRALYSVVQRDPLFTFHVTTQMRKRRVQQRDYGTGPTPRVKRTLTPDPAANDYGY